jgi:hypothetical protein
MSTCITCGQDAGIFKVQCRACFDAAQEDIDPAPKGAQQSHEIRRQQAEIPPEVSNESEDNPQVTANSRSLGGRFLRLSGMAVIVAVTLAILFSWEALEPGIFIGLLAIGLAGAAMHYKGRKLAPGKHGASILGGILGGGAIVSAVVIIAAFFFFALVEGCEAFFKL